MSKKPFKETGFGKLLWGIGDRIDDTIRGENKVGQLLNKVLPAQKIREGLGAAVLGIKDVAPVTMAKEAKTTAKAQKLKKSLQAKGVVTSAGDEQRKREEIAERIKALDPEDITDLLYQGYDLVDDGRLNKSADQLSPELKLKIRLGVSALAVAYGIYALITGDFTLVEAITYIGL